MGDLVDRLLECRQAERDKLSEKPCEHFKSWAELGLRTNQCQHFNYHNGGTCEEGGIFKHKPCPWSGYPEGSYKDKEVCDGEKDVET